MQAQQNHSQHRERQVLAHRARCITQGFTCEVRDAHVKRRHLLCIGLVDEALCAVRHQELNDVDVVHVARLCGHRQVCACYEQTSVCLL